MNLPNIFVHTIYKEYAEMLKDQEKSKNHAAEQVEDEVEEAMGGQKNYMDRVMFIGSVGGIHYPEMIVNFFDHFVALKQLVEDSGRVNVLQSTESSISFSIDFDSIEIKDQALGSILSQQGVIVIYERPIRISVKILTDLSLQIDLS